MQHTDRKHARLSASRMDRVMSCPGSYRLEEKMPFEPAGEAAAIGTAIHELSERILRGEAVNPKDYPDDHMDMANEYATFINTLVINPRKRMIEVNVDAGLKTLHQARLMPYWWMVTTFMLSISRRVVCWSMPRTTSNC